MTRVFSCAPSERGLSAETITDKARFEVWVATYHIIDPAEETVAPFPFAHDFGVMLCLVACAVFLAREAALSRLQAAFVPAKQRLGVSLVVFAEVASSIER
jgi:hypothetical protein